MIDEAFEGVTLPMASPTVPQAMARDYDHQMPRATPEERTDWSNLADRQFEYGGQLHTFRRLVIDGGTAYPFCFFDDASVRFHLPAAMHIALDEAERNPRFDIGFFASQMLSSKVGGLATSLTDAQQAAVVCFVEHGIHQERREWHRQEGLADWELRAGDESDEVSELASRLREAFGMPAGERLPRPRQGR